MPNWRPRLGSPARAQSVHSLLMTILGSGEKDPASLHDHRNSRQPILRAYQAYSRRLTRAAPESDDLAGEQPSRNGVSCADWHDVSPLGALAPIRPATSGSPSNAWGGSLSPRRVQTDLRAHDQQ